jgi:hypothetical protein
MSKVKYIKVGKVEFAVEHVAKMTKKEDFEKTFPMLASKAYWEPLKAEIKKLK